MLTVVGIKEKTGVSTLVHKRGSDLEQTRFAHICTHVREMLTYEK